MKVAIIGLYNSGSSVLSAIMEQLGFNIGRPLWEPHFESRSLRAQLIDWWAEPGLVEQVGPEHRIPFLRWWADHHASSNPEGMVCAKHPLLCLSAYDLEEAWGADLKIIRAARPFDESLAGLERRHWFREPAQMQRTLDAAAGRFFSMRDHHEIDYRDLTADPAGQVERLVSFLGIQPSAERMTNAAGLVRR